MGAAGFHGRVRNGVGWDTRAIGHQVDQPPPAAPHQLCDLAGARPPRHGRDEERAPWRGAGGAGARQVSGMGPRQVGSTLGAGLRLSLPAGEVGRAIRTGQLHASPRVHTRPIDVVVCHGSDSETWSCGGFPA